MSYGNSFSHTSSSSKRSTSCSHNNPSLSKPPAATNNNNNPFYGRYSANSGMSLLQQPPSHLASPYSSSGYRQYKMPSYLSDADPPPSIKCDGANRYRSQGSVPREVIVKSTYRPDNGSVLADHRDPRFGSLAKTGRNAELGELSLSGLLLSSPKSLKKSSSHQDMLAAGTNVFPGRYSGATSRYSNGSACTNRPLPDFCASVSRRTLPSNLPSPFQSSRRPSVTRSRISSGGNCPEVEGSARSDGAVRSSVADAVARLNRRNEAERILSFSRRSQVQGRQNPEESSEQTVEANDKGGVEFASNGESSSPSLQTSGSPNNNTNNFSKKYMNKGCTGLQNIGNTCFMNCVLQCLANTRPLLELCLNSDLLKEINTESSRLKGSIVTAYVDLMQSMWRGSDTISPSNFKYEVSRFARLFAGYNQQDAQEFLMYLLQGLHEDLNRVKDKKKKVMGRRNSNSLGDDDDVSVSEKAILSWKKHLELENSYVVDLFEGLLKSALKCRLCGYVSNTFDPFLGLSLPIKKVPGYGDTTLMDCLELFTHEELLDENEKTTCAKCKKKQNSTKRLSIQKFPKILIINLKRFSEESLFRSKLSTLVRYPVKNLDLRKFSDENVGDRAVYSLYGLCNHLGTPSGGHYTAFAKNPYSTEWHLFNDQRVSNAGENGLISHEAYILFYEINQK